MSGAHPLGIRARLACSSSAARSGFSLVELLCATLILIVVALGWFKIMNATSPYREAQKRAAIELAAGILDVFYPAKPDNMALPLGWYRFEGDEKGYPFTQLTVASGTEPERQYFPKGYFPEDSLICYTLRYRMGCVYNSARGSGETSKDNQNTAYPTDSEQWHKWKGMAEELYRISKNKFNPYVVEISLYENELAEKPFAIFSQVVAFARNASGVTGF